MFSTTTGWAQGTLRTTDGGAHWLDVSPPSIPGRAAGYAEFILDATHAWVAETGGSSKACADHVVTFRTTDGGKTWQKGSVISVKVAAATDVIWTDAGTDWMYFTDAQNGWMLVESGPDPWAADLWRVGALYRTTNGGLSWTLLSTNSGFIAGCRVTDGIYFASTTTGWLRNEGLNQGTCAAKDAGLLVTHDGGATWAVQVLPVSTYALPVFFDASRGIIPTSPLLVTSDGGATWSSQGMLPPGTGTVDFINPAEGWVIVNAAQAPATEWHLYRTNNGGETWSPVGTGPFSSSYGYPNSLYFVDGNNGFVAFGYPPDWILLRTSDGGRTWTQVQTTISKPGG